MARRGVVVRATSTAPRPSASAFDVVLDRALSVMQNGKRREVTPEEALQHTTYRAAIKGDRAARREVLRG